MRHAKELQRRAQAHGVLDVTESGFVVESGRSGKRYTVTVFGPESVLCSCPWGNHKGTACSHVLSVFRWAAEKLKGRRVSAWADGINDPSVGDTVMGELCERVLHLSAFMISGFQFYPPHAFRSVMKKSLIYCTG